MVFLQRQHITVVHQTFLLDNDACKKTQHLLKICKFIYFFASRLFFAVKMMAYKPVITDLAL